MINDSYRKAIELILGVAAEGLDKESARTSMTALQVDLSDYERRKIAQLHYFLNYPGFDDGNSLFVCTGLFKAGTTWFGKLLDAHPGLSCKGKELHPFSRQIEELYTGRSIENLPEGQGKEWHRIIVENRRSALFSQILETVDNPRAKRIGARSPVLNVELLFEAFPHAKVPVIIRDPRDIAVSAAYFHSRYYDQSFDGVFLDSERKTIDPKYVEGWCWQAGEYYGWVDGLCGRYPDQLLITRYEDLLNKPTETLKGIYQFLDVADDNDLVESCLKTCSFEVMSGGRKKGDENPASFYRKGVAGDWKNHFNEDGLKASLVAEAIMKKYDYLD